MGKWRFRALSAAFFVFLFFLCASAPLTGVPAAEKVQDKRFSRFFNRGEKETLAKMSLEEKVGQLLIFGFQGKTLDDDFRRWLETGKLGNVKIFLRNVESGEQVKRLTGEIEELCSKTGSRVPPFIATDMEGGTVNHIRYPGIALAPAAGLVGATRRDESARVSSRLIALTLAGIGINMNFAPCADVLTEPENRVIMTRSYGSDPVVVSRMVKAFVEEHARLGILPVMKHFPGHGMTGFDSHIVSDKVDIGRRELERVHLVPYAALIKDRTLDGCMTAHIIYSALDPESPATFSSAIVEGLLRAELGFKGVVVTDELEMEGAQKVAKGIVESFVRAFDAGNDLFLVGHTKSKEETMIDELPRLFAEGVLSEKELDRRVLRVLAQKKRYIKLFQEAGGRAASSAEYAAVVDANRIMAREGIVLLSSRVDGSIPDFLDEAAEKKKRGVILAPTDGFARLAKSYAPEWDVIDIGYRPDKDANTKKATAERPKLKSYDLAMLGFANDTQGEWAAACGDEKLPYFILSIENPFAARQYAEKALFIVAAFGPNSPATDALFRSVFTTGEFRGRFPYDL